MFSRALLAIATILISLPVYSLDSVGANRDGLSRVQLIEKLQERTANFQSIEVAERSPKDNGGWGGGTSVLRGQQAPLFYDLYLSHPDFQDSYTIQPNLPDTKFLQSMGYEYFEVKKLAEYQPLLKELEKWRPKAAGLVDLIVDSLNNMEISYTNIPLVRIDGLILSTPLKPGHTLEPVILFNRTMHARINRPLWNRLGDRSRMAALVHEAFRNLQIVTAFHGLEPQMDSKIQQVTNFLMMTHPSEVKGALDYTRFFDPWMLKYLLINERNNLTLIEHAELSNDKFLTNPVLREGLLGARYQQNEETFRAFQEEARKTNSAVAGALAIVKKHYGELENEPQARDVLKITEDFIRRYLNDPSSLGRKDRFEAATYAKALRMMNRYLQERWLDDPLFSLVQDLKRLIYWQFENPRIDLFGNMEKFSCITNTVWSTPVERFQTRDTDQFEKLREQAKAGRDKCQEALIAESPESARVLLRSFLGTSRAK